MKYICITPDGKRVLTYHKEIGTRRVYRRYTSEKDTNFYIFEFTHLKDAEELCKEVNPVYFDNFEPKLTDGI